MSRFFQHRWMTLIVAFGLVAASFAVLPRVTHAGGSVDGGITDPWLDDGSGSNSGNGGLPPGSGVGDPDDPQSGLKNRSVRGSVHRMSVQAVPHPVGDGRVDGRVMLWRLQVAFQALLKAHYRV